MRIVFSEDEDKQIGAVAERLGTTTTALKVRLRNIYEANLYDDLEWVVQMVEEDKLLEEA